MTTICFVFTQVELAKCNVNWLMVAECYGVTVFVLTADNGLNTSVAACAHGDVETKKMCLGEFFILNIL